MFYKFLYSMLCKAYTEILRDLLIKAINDPNEIWDDMVLDILDRLFDYKK